MSRSPASRGWGPSHQHRDSPKSNRLKLKLGAITLVLIACELFAHRVLAQGAGGAASSTLGTSALAAAPRREERPAATAATA
jgi:hypothetical protein